MSRFLDGPAVGVTLTFARTPIYLRVVQNTATLQFDVLDQPDDEPAAEEFIHVYRRVSEPVRAHINNRGSRKGPRSGWYSFADYRHIADVDGEDLRDTAAWRLWCHQRAEAEAA